MKKKKAGKTASKKGGAAPKTVEEYLSRVQEPARGTLEKVRAAILSAVPPETTEVISYGIPAFRHKKVLMWYAAFSDHCSLFPTSAVIEEFKDELKKYPVSKGTIQFPIDKPLPATLVKKLTKARIARNESKKKG